MAIGYGPAGMLGVAPHNLLVNVIIRNVGLGPGGVASVERDFARFSSAAERSAGRTAAAGTMARRAWSNIGIGAGVVSAVTVYHLGKAAVAWDQFTKRQQANSQMTGREFDQMKKKSLELASATGGHAEDIAESWRYATDRSIRRMQAYRTVLASLQLALPTGASLTKVQQAMLQTGTAFGVRPRDYGRLATQLHIAQQLGGNVTMEQFVEALPRVTGMLGLSARQRHLFGRHGAVSGSLATFSALTQFMPAPQAAAGAAQLGRAVVQPGPRALAAAQQLAQEGGPDLTRVLGMTGVQRYGFAGVIQRLDAAYQEIKRVHGQNAAIQTFRPLLSTSGGGIRATTALLNMFSPQGSKILEHNLLAMTGGTIGGRQVSATEAQRRFGIRTPRQLFEIYEHSPAGEARTLRERFHVMSIQIGTGLLPTLLKFENALMAITGFIMPFIAAHPNAAAGALGVMGAVGGAALLGRVVGGVRRGFAGYGLTSRMFGLGREVAPLLDDQGAVVEKGMKAGWVRRLGGQLPKLRAGLRGAYTAAMDFGKAGLISAANWAKLTGAQILGGLRSAGTMLRTASIWAWSNVRAGAAMVVQWARQGVAAVVQGARIVASVVAQGAAWLGVRAAMLAGAVATGIATAAQWALNVAMDANPIGLIVVAIGALTAGIILAYTHFKPFRQIVDTVFGAITKGAMFVVGWLQRNWKTALFVLLTGPIGLAYIAIQHFFPNLHRTIVHGVTSVLSWLGSHWMLIGAIMVAPFLPGVLLGYLVVKFWPQISKFFTGMFSNIIGAFGAFGKLLGNTWNTIWTGVTTWLTSNWKTILLTGLTTILLGPESFLFTTVFSKLPGYVLTWTGTAFGKMIDAIKGLASKLWHAGLTAGKHIIDGIMHFFKGHNPVSWLKDKVGGFFGDVGGFVTSHLPGGGGFGSSGGQTAGLGTSFLGQTYTGGFVNSGQEAGNYAMFKGNRIPYHGALTDYDYSTTAGGGTVKLPGGSNAMYQYLGSYSLAGMGTAEFFRTPNGGVFAVNHLQSVTPGLKAGMVVSGGTAIGISGEPTSSKFGSGWHLCLVTDPSGQQYLLKVSDAQLNGKQAISNAPLPGTPKNISQWSQEINRAAAATGLSPYLIAGVMATESSGNQFAVSSTGAKGLMQLEPGTAAQYGGSTFNPQQNVMEGAKYLLYLYNGPAHHDWTTALEMYNAGPAGNLPGSAGYAAQVLSTGRSYASGGVHGGGGYQQPHMARGGGNFYSKTWTPPGYKAQPVPGQVEWKGSGPNRHLYIYEDTQMIDGHTQPAGWYRADEPVPGQLQYTASGKLQVYRGGGFMSGPGGTMVYQKGGYVNVNAVPPPHPGQIRYQRGVRQEYYGQRTVNGVTLPAGYYNIGGQTRQLASGAMEEWVPLPNGGGRWQIIPGQERYSRAGVVQRYEGPSKGPGGVLRPAGWYNLPTDVRWKVDRISQLDKLYPVSKAGLANMTPAEQQKWLRGRDQIDKLQQQVNDARYKQQYQAGQFGRVGTPQALRHLHRLIAGEVQVRRQSDMAAVQKLHTALYGGPETGVYRAYHVYQTQHCAAETANNKHHQQTATSSKKSAHHLQNIDKNIAAMAQHAGHAAATAARAGAAAAVPHHGSHPKSSQHAPPPRTGHPAPAHKPHLAAHEGVGDDPRFHGHQTLPEVV